MKDKFSSKYLLIVMITLAFGIIVVAMSAMMAWSESNTSDDFKFISGEIKTYSVDMNVKDPKTNLTKSYKMDTQSGETLLSFMKNLKDSDQGFTFTYSESHYGTLITGINGYEADSNKKEYWKLFINNKVADVGFTDYVLSGGDTLSWELDHF